MATITATEWSQSEAALRQLRETVFMQEQHISAADEWDGKDESARHYLVTEARRPIGCARLLINGPDGKIGRVAILPAFRRKHLATDLLHFVISDAMALGLQTLHLDAQTSVTSLYEKLGFVAHGNTFEDAGILHQSMTLVLASP